MSDLIPLRTQPPDEKKAPEHWKDLPKPMPIGDIWEDPPQRPPQHIAGLLYEGGKMLFVGGSKSRKTFAMLDLSIAMATGSEWLGFKCALAPTLFLDMELLPHEAPERIAKISAARDLRPETNLHLWRLRGYCTTVEKLRPALVEYCREHGVKAIVVDPYYKLSGGTEQNDNDAVADLLGRIEAMATEAGASFIFSHHSAKGDSSTKHALDVASGAGTFGRDPDLIVAMRETSESTKEAPRVRLDIEARSFPPVPNMVLRWQYPVWHIDQTGDHELMQQGRPPKASVDDILKHLGNDWMPQPEWQNACQKSEISDSTFNRLLKKAKDRELITTMKVGRLNHCRRSQNG